MYAVHLSRHGGQVQGTAQDVSQRDRVLRAAVNLADTDGIEALSMRRLADDLGVVPMALYKHVAHKEELLDGMINIVVSEIDPPDRETDWKSAVRKRILSAREALLRHPWASRVLEARANPTPDVLAYMDSMIALFTENGFSISLTHHLMHAIGSRVLGFTQELFNELTQWGAATARDGAARDGKEIPERGGDSRGSLA